MCHKSRKYAALVVRTSAAGGCHIWLHCHDPLDEDERLRAQRYLALRLGADRGSTSGEHLGRLAGFKNWKRSGVWVNVLRASEYGPWQPASALAEQPPRASPRRVPGASKGPAPHGIKASDTSPSGADWAFACRKLEAGCAPGLVLDQLVERARPRRGTDAAHYADHTLRRALRRIATPIPAPEHST